MERHNEKAMQKAWSVALGLLIVAFFLLLAHSLFISALLHFLLLLFARNDGTLIAHPIN
jgi:hypothetical protein